MIVSLLISAILVSLVKSAYNIFGYVECLVGVKQVVAHAADDEVVAINLVVLIEESVY